jgi:hypothetical protein
MLVLFGRTVLENRFMKTRLLIVADLGLLKAYKLELREEGSPRMHLLEQLALEPAQKHLAEQITDSAGRRAAPGGNMGGGTITDGHNLELETKRRLIRQIARKIEDLAGAHPSDACWLAAQKEILRPVVESLPHSLHARIEKKVPSDLTKLEPKQVLGHFLAQKE